jgi:cell wall-associated NlpC family hydrolase
MTRTLLLALLTLALGGPVAVAQDAVAPPSGVLGVGEAQLTPEFWVANQEQPDRVILDGQAIAAQNARLYQVDPTMHDLRSLGTGLNRAQVQGWIEKMSQRPSKTLYDMQGNAVPPSVLDTLMAQLAIDAIPATQPTRYGMVVRRAPLRSFPTAMRVFNRTGDTDIDRFQESAEFPGTPVVIAHTSANGQWYFVVTPRYAAWMEKQYVAEGTADEVLGYAAMTPYRVVTGATVRTVFTPEAPPLSQLQLDMSARIPLQPNLPPDQPVNGQHAYSSYTLRLPWRDGAGKLQFGAALLQRNADSSANYLPLTRANIVRQAFKFLGERYGWGHDYNGRDCSGFVSDVYRSMGVEMPRNTRDQSVSPGLNHQAFGPNDSHDARLRAAMALQTGDLVYIPGHVMMVIGHIDGKPYVIHDTGGMSYRAADGAIHRVKLNEVSVTPLLPLLFNDQQTYIDRMTSIVRIRP